MERIISAGTVAAGGRPAAPASGTPQYAADGTVWPAYIFNTIQEELLAVITAGGIAPDRTVETQLRDAITALISAATGIATPPGVVMSTAGNAAPAGWKECDGSAISRAGFAALFAAVGTTYGAGDGVTTFNLPDLRGQFIRGYDHGRGVDAARVLGSQQQDAMQGHLHGPPTGADTYRVHKNAGNTQDSNGGAASDYLADTGSPVSDGANGVPRTASETRPVNVALLFIIKT